MKLKKIFIVLLIIFISIPNFIFVNAEQPTEELTLYSQAAILIDNYTGKTLYEKNSNEKLYPASTTKILTAIIAIENCDLNATTTVTKTAVLSVPPGYSSSYLSEGEVISIKDLLTVLLVHSANDAGFVLAEYISGSTEAFAELMNKKASEIGCKNSNFLNPSGIHNSDHYTTAYDLALIARYCMKNDTFREIVCQSSCVISPTNKFGERKYLTTNDLLNPSSKYYMEDCIGIKTGFTSQAQSCLITGFSKDGLELICVILGGNYLENGDRATFTDAHTLHDYGYKNYSMKTVFSKGDVGFSTTVANATKKTKNLDLILEDDLKVLIKTNENIPEPTIDISETIFAPINPNDNLATISYTIDGITYTSNLLASHEVKKSYFSIFLLIFVIVIMIIFIRIRINILKLKKKKRKRKKKYKSYRI